MQRKTSSIVVLVLFVLSIVAIPGIPSVFAQPVISIGDYEFVTETDLVCTYFNVTVDVTGVADMKGVGIKMTYNATLIHSVRVYPTAITSDATKWLPTNATGGFNFDQDPVINNTIPQVWINAWGFTPYTGSGSVFIIEFHIELAPPYGTVTVPENKTVSCALDITEFEVLDSSADPIPGTTATDGSYTYIRPQKVVGTPTAVCNVNPSSVYEGTNVNFDGSLSDDGGTGTGLTYLWDVNSDGTFDINTTIAVSTWANPVAGTFNVTLTVVNDIPLNNTVASPQYWDVIAKAGALIDLYTSPNRWCGIDTSSSLPGEGVGKGPGMPCDALSPDVNFTLFAEVTYNGAPVNHVLVAFEVRWMWEIDWNTYDPDNSTWTFKDECVLFRTAETDKDGIARIWFRIPTPCTGQMFGKWKAWAKAKVQEVPIEDSMDFDVGYLVTMSSLTILNPYPSAFIRESDSLRANITFKSISWIPRTVKFFLVVYDECDVPLGQAWVDLTTEPAYYCSPTGGTIEIGGILIPQYAYVGYGKVYASAFTDFPHNCGQAYCPELGVTDIYIDWLP